MAALRAAVLLAVLAGVVHTPQPAHAALLPCGPQQEPDAARQAQALQIAALVREELERSGATVALVARSGLDLARFGQRYSHAGLSLRHNPASPWAVRQLYYACDERRSRVFDQGLAAFLLGTEDPAHGFMSVVLPEPQQAQALERAALDDARALSLLGASYSANAYAFGLRHQNCNQWVAELLATAWGGLSAGVDTRAAAPADTPAGARAAAQAWLREQGLQPAVFDVAWPPLRWLAAFIPWVHEDDHPEDDLQAGRYRVVMPLSLERLVRERSPGARRLEFCHTAQHLVVRRGWTPIGESCVAGPGDAVHALQALHTLHTLHTLHEGAAAAR
ncbi:MAG: DUF2145 domain-containing protein [Rubrivivax sp.]